MDASGQSLGTFRVGANYDAINNTVHIVAGFCGRYARRRRSYLPVARRPFNVKRALWALSAREGVKSFRAHAGADVKVEIE